MKKIFINSVSKRYLIGTYTFLESLKKYNHTEDVHILYYQDITQEDLNQIKEKNYPFTIYFQPISELRKKYPIDIRKQAIKGWDCRFYQHQYALNFDNTVFCFWNGDALLLNNIYQYLDIAEKYTIVSSNFHHYESKDIIGKRLKLEPRNPYYDIPVITSNKKLIEEIWKEGLSEGIKYRGRGDMKCLYNAINTLNLFNKIFTVSYSHWINNHKIRLLPIQKNNEYYYPDGTRINAVHGPLWSLGHATSPRHTEWSKEFNKIFHKIYVSTSKIYTISKRTFR